MDTIEKCAAKHKTKWGKFKGWIGMASDDQNKVEEEKLPVSHMPSSDVPAPSSIPVKFTILSKNEREARMAAGLLESELEKQYITRNVIDNLIKNFSPEQTMTIKRMGAAEKVEVDINKTKGEVILKGIEENVYKVVSKTNEIISDAQQQKFHTQKSQLVNDVVQWSYVEVNGGKKSLIEFPDDVNYLIENGFQGLKGKVELCDQKGETYVVDFNENTFSPKTKPRDVCQVVRKTKLNVSSFTPPSNWDAMDESETLKKVKLKSSSAEYKTVIQEFCNTGGQGYTIVKVERIQNKTLYQQYLAKKKQMEDTNPAGTKNERMLWHGTDQKAEDSITRLGFNRSFCGKNATRFGEGVYFAVNANYSMSDTYSRPDANGHKRMYYCRVLTGEFTTGHSSYRVPPNKRSKSGNHILYDSVTDNPASPSMFIIFHDSQAVADYLITFKR